LGDCIQGAFSSDTTISTPVAINKGGTGQTTAQAAIDALTAVSGASTNEVLTKDGSGNAVFAAAAGGGDLVALFDSTLGSAADEIKYTAELKDDVYGYFVLECDGDLEQQTAVNLVVDAATSAEYNYWGATYSSSSVRTALSGSGQTTLPVATTTVVTESATNDFSLRSVFSIPSTQPTGISGYSTYLNYYSGLVQTISYNTWGTLSTSGEINSIALSAPTQDFSTGTRMRIWGAKV